MQHLCLRLVLHQGSVSLHKPGLVVSRLGPDETYGRVTHPFICTDKFVGVYNETWNCAAVSVRNRFSTKENF